MCLHHATALGATGLLSVSVVPSSLDVPEQQEKGWPPCASRAAGRAPQCGGVGPTSVLAGVEAVSTVCSDCVWPVHSSADGHLGGVRPRASAKSAARSAHVQVSLSTGAGSRVMQPEVGLLGPRAVPCVPH